MPDPSKSIYTKKNGKVALTSVPTSREEMTIGLELTPEQGGDAPCLFAPIWGKHASLLWQLVAATQAGELLPTLDSLLSESAIGDADADYVRVLFSLSLLRDVVRAGGSAVVRDSRLFISWPDWSGPDGRRYARKAMAGARDMRPLTGQEIERVRPMFAPDMDGESFVQVLAEARYALRAVSEAHPSGVSYQEAFAAALRYWTMPYRGRTGRMRRFVLTAEHPLLGPWPVLAGVLELGDEAPFCTWRDRLLGLSPASFGEWLQSKDSLSRAEIVAARLRSIRSCLRATSDGWDLSSIAAEEVVQQRHALEKASHGRSLVLTDERELLKDRKRLAYGLRLARGEAALRKVAHGGALDIRDPDISAGVRGMHDLILPRLHLEATVCGAVPPFAQALAGKLLVSFLSHPDILAAPLGAEGELLGWSFDSERLSNELPSEGMLCLTTKGLYAGHAAIYNRGEAPGLTRPVRLKHLDNTEGQTTSLISTLTTRLARRQLEEPSSLTARVSSLYGSGGAKRHRAIEKATIDVGLPSRLVMAGIRRPVYGIEFVSNAPAVSWLGEAPDWRVRRHESSEEFSKRALELWKARWLTRAVDRVRDYALIPSLIRTIQTGSCEEEQ